MSQRLTLRLINKVMLPALRPYIPETQTRSTSVRLIHKLLSSYTNIAATYDAHMTLTPQQSMNMKIATFVGSSLLQYKDSRRRMP